MKKQVWFRQGELPHFTQIAHVVVPPGKVFTAHADMHELFIILEGTARMVVNGAPHEFIPGNTIAFGPGEAHEISKTRSRPVHLIVAGWTDTPAS